MSVMIRKLMAITATVAVLSTAEAYGQDPERNGAAQARKDRDSVARGKDNGGMQMFSGIMYVTVFVSDQDKALDFYTNTLGFQKRADYKGTEGSRFLTIALKDQGFEVLLWLGTPGRAKATPGVGTLFIESDDLRKAFAELKARGVKFLEPEPETYAFGLRVTALDPDGNPVALRQRRQ